jgi:hypothetical protein
MTPNARPLAEASFVIALGVGALILLNNFALGMLVVLIVLLMFIGSAI